MGKTIVWIVVLTFLLAGLYSVAWQKSDSGHPNPVAARQGAGSDTSTSGVRMYAHYDTDHYSDNDHCISLDARGNEKPLFVEIDLSNDPGSDPMMDLALLYTRIGEAPHAETLSSVCKRIGPAKTTCKARFDEKRKDRRGEALAWHLGDQPDGVYSTAGTLSTTVALKTNTGVLGLFTYSFRNPKDCNASFGKARVK